MNNRGQIAIFVIVAAVIVGAIIVFFAVRGNLGISGVPAELQPVFDRHLGCIEDATSKAVGIAGLQGGRIYSGDYEPGSDYAPFSSKLDFLGVSVPYWMHLSANGILKEDVPTKKEIETEIGRYVDEQLEGCDFSDFYEQGFGIELGTPRTSVVVNQGSVDVQVNRRISVSRGESSAQVSTQKSSYSSKFGEFYSIATELYSLEQRELFLENYSVDALRSYVPVDGVEVTCAPKIWKTQETIDELREALSSNIGAIQFANKGGYFYIKNPVNANVQLIYDKSWPSSIEVTPADELMVAHPVGNDAALGAMGFCYVPYHFVYDVNFPVMFQIYDGLDLFQFPVSVIIDNNVPRNAVSSGLGYEEQPDVCSFRNSEAKIRTYDVGLNPINADVSFQCFDSLCSLGNTDDGELDAKLPACVNGIVIARSEGYRTRRALFSSNTEREIDLILDREHEVQVELTMDGRPIGGTAVIQFVGQNERASMAYPDSSSVVLAEDLYNISVLVYGNSSIVIPASTKTECQDVPRTGIAGFFGSTREQCFDISLPETRIDYALLGGGNSVEYLFERDLERGIIKIDVPSTASPSSLEQVQYSFEAVRSARAEVTI